MHVETQTHAQPEFLGPTLSSPLRSVCGIGLSGIAKSPVSRLRAAPASAAASLGEYSRLPHPRTVERGCIRDDALRVLPWVVWKGGVSVSIAEVGTQRLGERGRLTWTGSDARRVFTRSDDQVAQRGLLHAVVDRDPWKDAAFCQLT